MDLFDGNLQQLAKEMKIKQQYVKDYVIDYKYDVNDFYSYLSYQKTGGEDLANWTIDDLSSQIHAYYAYVDPSYAQANYNQPVSDQMSDQLF